MIRMAGSLLAGFLFVCFNLNLAHAEVLSGGDGVYQFTEEAVTTTGVHFAKGEAVHLENLGATVRVRFQLAAEEAGDADLTILSLEEVQKLPLELSALALSSEFQAWSSQPMKRTGGNRLHYKGATGCVAYVLRAIGWRGGRSGNGWEVTRTLRRMGWHTVSCSSPEYGTVASWSGGHGGAGHTAIWQGCWAYDLACADPGRGYHLIDCVAR